MLFTLIVFAMLLIALVIAPAIFRAVRRRRGRRTPQVNPLALELARIVNPYDPDVLGRLALSGHPTALDKSKQKLRELESELADARGELKELGEARDKARDEFADSDEQTQDSDAFKAAMEAQEAYGACEDRIDDLEKVQLGLLKMRGGKTDPRADRHATGEPSDPREGAWDAPGLHDAEIVATLERFTHSKSKMGTVELGEVISRDAFAADVVGTTNMRRGDFGGIIPQLRRRLSVLDLIPTGTMNENTFPYSQETGSFATAAETAEGSQKPQADEEFTDEEAIAQTIAHWSKLQKQSLNDVPALQSIVAGRLQYGVGLRLEGQIINGSGSGGNLQGILHTSGIGTATFVAGTSIVEQILKAITTVYLANAEANGIIMHPLDWQAALTLKAQYTASGSGADAVTGGSGEYIGGGPFSITPQQLWGVPLIPSIAVAQGTPLVGDFALGAQLLIREGVQVLLSDSDQDDFIRNRVTLLAEMRAALPVFRPACFCEAPMS